MSIQRGCGDRASIGISECFSNVFLPLCSGIFRWFSIFKFICSSRWFTFSVGSDKHLKSKSGELKQQQSEEKKISEKQKRTSSWNWNGKRRRRGQQEDSSNAMSVRSKNFEIFPFTVRRQEKSFAANVALLSSAQPPPPPLHREMHFAELFGNAQLVSFSRESSVSPLTGENFHIFPITPPIFDRTRAKMCNMLWTLCRQKRRVTVSKFNDQWAFTTCKCSLHTTHHRGAPKSMLFFAFAKCYVLCAGDVRARCAQFFSRNKKKKTKKLILHIFESQKYKEPISFASEWTEVFRLLHTVFFRSPFCSSNFASSPFFNFEGFSCCCSFPQFDWRWRNERIPGPFDFELYKSVHRQHSHDETEESVSHTRSPSENMRLINDV